MGIRATFAIATALVAVAVGSALAGGENPLDAIATRVIDLMNNNSKRVFVTSTTYSGNLGGLDGADRECQKAAAVAGVPGVYMAWLSDLTQDLGPATRFLTHAAIPYTLTDGTRIADDWDDLTDGELQHGIDVDEFKQPLCTGFGCTSTAWTGTDAAGFPRAAHPLRESCADWHSGESRPQGLAGVIDRVNETWTVGGFGTCNSERRLYCFGQ